VTAYTTISAPAEDEFVEKRSRFLCAIAPVTTPEEATAFLNARREEHYDARHTVFAYVLREGNVQRYSDDGEPQGTGGMPVLEVIRRSGLTDVCIAVTRYFGGILLGAGGLTRAYANGAALAVAAAKTVTMCPCVLFRVQVDYALYGTMERLFAAHGAMIVNSDFGAAVTLEGKIREENFEPLCRAVTETTGAAVSLAEIGREFGAI
jgi:uncharacterized YigZ family protein